MSLDTHSPTAIPWGLLGPDALSSERRTRALDLGAAVRHYNELAVPGMGGVWYGRQLLWPTLGVLVADAVRQRGRSASNIEVANTIEALACWLALRYGSARRDPRLRGVTKLRVDEPTPYKRLGRAGAYVSQPMRMAAVQPLRALGLVSGESDRFNAFAPSTAGAEFVRAACAEFEPVKYNDGVPAYLRRWVLGEHADAHRDRLHDALSPLKPLPPAAIAVLKDRLLSGPPEPAARRRAALAWVAQSEKDTAVPDWDAPPPPMLDARHWHDLRIGAAFFRVRDLAIEALDCAERAIGPEPKPLKLDAAMPEAVAQALDLATDAARTCLRWADRRHEHPDALAFCDQLLTDTTADRLRALVERDGRVLQLRDHAVVPAAAFGGAARVAANEEAGPDDTPQLRESPWPEGISHRVRNLHLLHLDMEGRLDAWLQQEAAA